MNLWSARVTEWSETRWEKVHLSRMVHSTKQSPHRLQSSWSLPKLTQGPSPHTSNILLSIASVGNTTSGNGFLPRPAWQLWQTKCKQDGHCLRWRYFSCFPFLSFLLQFVSLSWNLQSSNMLSRRLGLHCGRMLQSRQQHGRAGIVILLYQL